MEICNKKNFKYKHYNQRVISALQEYEECLEALLEETATQRYEVDHFLTELNEEVAPGVEECKQMT